MTSTRGPTAGARRDAALELVCVSFFGFGFSWLVGVGRLVGWLVECVVGRSFVCARATKNNTSSRLTPLTTPHNSKARKAAAAATTGGGGGGGAGGEWERPSRLQQRRDGRRAKAAEEKMKRLKTQSFDKTGLFAGRQQPPPQHQGARGGSGGGMTVGGGGGEADELQCEHFLECAGCFFRSGCVLWRECVWDVCK
jgi:hypothetical protein